MWPKGPTPQTWGATNMLHFRGGLQRSPRATPPMHTVTSIFARSGVLLASMNFIWVPPKDSKGCGKLIYLELEGHEDILNLDIRRHYM